ncbi:glycosyltransferase family 2 protein [Acuticoccus sp. MNP-M23]|uniref:glycosyltransferase family 2 protein n=1 Tax=Acuticoccus sp. MNP-M23 TaxID=3072793 RepID=UPI002815F1F5|nr:glycosyltransferase family 2 protein [Acuticoccus sp. MNP-M23]WMS43374.1 glycosyltransferase family 2 protein [Acuticoccus sp. MNP-M23]
MAEATINTSVIVCTLDRLDLLRRCLDSLAAQTFTDPFEVVVVDNAVTEAGDPRVAAEVERANAARPGTFVYRHSVGPNLSTARNTGLEASRGTNIAFVDDDLVLPPDWLATIVSVLRQTGADGVLGLVRPRFLPGGEMDGLERHFTRDLPLPEGAPVGRNRHGFIDGVRTCNVIVRRSRTFGQGIWFDPAFGRSGGEDQDVFILFARRPAFRLAYSPAAEAEELIPPERQNARYLKMRAFRNSQVFVRVLTKHRPNPRLAALMQRIIGTIQWGRARTKRLLARPQGLARVEAEIAEATAAGKVFWRRPDLPGPYQ